MYCCVPLKFFAEGYLFQREVSNVLWLLLLGKQNAGPLSFKEAPLGAVRADSVGVLKLFSHWFFSRGVCRVVLSVVQVLLECACRLHADAHDTCLIIQHLDIDFHMNSGELSEAHELGQ